ncbi:hypothetical protein HCG51_16990 [Tolypothrix sp. PCC 7910]|nr:hypothetical protein [Tolypothrix sp. PCC 7910]QIR38235.1 hypothetical protein HCG51_16990 [Tolypothrix sp. PCC 7910]
MAKLISIIFTTGDEAGSISVTPHERNGLGISICLSHLHPAGKLLSI